MICLFIYYFYLLLITFISYHPDEFFSLRKNKNRSATDVIEAVKLGQPYAFLEKR